MAGMSRLASRNFDAPGGAAGAVMPQAALAGYSGAGFMRAMKKTKVAVLGASGYSGIELLRILLRHPAAELVCVTSRQSAGKSVARVFPRFAGAAAAESLTFIAPDGDAIAATGAEVAFLALPHGVAHEYAIGLLERGLRVVDLSADFRLDDAAVYEEFYGHPHPAPQLLQEAVYGLPEINADAIRSARLVASPGCYPTSVLLPLIPLLRAQLLQPQSLCVFSMSGVSGAGRKESIPLLFCECNESVRAYSVPKHRHLSEIEQELGKAAGVPLRLTFTPHLIPVTAGIATTIYAAPAAGQEEADLDAVYRAAYASAPFVRLRGRHACPDTRDVVRTNYCDIGWSRDVRTGRLILLSAEDNLWKGAASQAVQSFNLMTGIPETAGLDWC
jgi:N-acetyl-gamma-glutamyl-phosphate reductase